MSLQAYNPLTGDFDLTQIVSPPFGNVSIQTNTGTAVGVGFAIKVMGTDGMVGTVSGDTVTLTPGYKKYVSPSIDFTATGATVIFTNGTSKFVLTGITLVSDVIDNYSGGASFSIGFTGPDYDDYITHTTDSVILSDYFNNMFVGVSDSLGHYPLLPASTALRVNVTSAAIADTFTGRIVVFGFTV